MVSILKHPASFAHMPSGARVLSLPPPVPMDCTSEAVRCYVENLAFDTTNLVHPTLPAMRAIDKTAWESGLQESVDYREGDNVVSSGSSCFWSFAASSAFGAPVVDSGVTAGTIIGTGAFCEDPSDPDYCSGDLYQVNNGLFNAFQVRIIGPSAGVYSVRFTALSFSVSAAMWPDCSASSMCANDGQCGDCDCIADDAALGFTCGGLPCIGFCEESCWQDYFKCDWVGGAQSPPGTAHATWYVGTADFPKPGKSPSDIAGFNGTYNFTKPGYTSGPTASIDLRFVSP